MDLRRARSGSPTERTDSKRGSISTDPYPLNLYPFCQGVDSPICSLFPESSVKLLAVEVFGNSDSDEVCKMALRSVEHLLEFLKDGFTISSAYLNEFYSIVREVWLNPRFAHCLRATIEKNRDPIGLILSYAKQDSPTDRMACMEADPCFKPCLMAMNSATRNTILRVFFSILIGHWSDESDLLELDKRMEKNVFERRMALIARARDIDNARAGMEDVVERFSYFIEDANQAMDMTPLREWLVSKYDPPGNMDIEAIVEEVKSDLSNLVDIIQRPMPHNYDGKKARINISITNGEYTGLNMETNPWRPQFVFQSPDFSSSCLLDG